MTEIKDGGPAFPHIEPKDPSFSFANNGMTLRDWFAGQAFSQAVDDYGQPEMRKSTGQRLDRGNSVLPYATAKTARETIIAYQAYRYADAMLKARGATS